MEKEGIEEAEYEIRRVTLNEELIKEWKNESNIENFLETLKEVNAFLVHKYGSPKFPKFSVEVLKDIQDIFVTHFPKASEEYKRALLKLIGILPHDETAAMEIFSNDVIEIILKASGLHPNSKVDGFRVVFDALRCLHHALHVSDKVQNIFIENCEPILFERMKNSLQYFQAPDEVHDEKFAYLNNATDILVEELLYYDLRLAFVSCLSSTKLQRKWITDLTKASLFLDILIYSYQKLSITKAGTPKTTKRLMVVQTSPWTVEIIDDPENMDETVEFLVIFQSFEMAMSALDILHHIHMYAEIFDVKFAQKCANKCAKIIESPTIDDDMKRGSARFLTAVPSCILPLCPGINKENTNKSSVKIYENHEMKFVDAILDLISRKLEIGDPIETRLLISFFVVLIHLCSRHKAARRYCRSILIPSSKSSMEDKKNFDLKLRKRILNLISESKSFCAKQAAELMFILCKRSVPRLIKYTGMENVPELLPQNEDIYRKRKDDSEDSENDKPKPKPSTTTTKTLPAKVVNPPATKKETTSTNAKKEFTKPLKSVGKLAPRMTKTEEEKSKKSPPKDFVPSMVRRFSTKSNKSHE